MGLDYSKMFASGEAPTLTQVLDHREKRVAYLNGLAKEYSGNTVICFKLNIPGPIKSNPVISDFFNTSHSSYLQELGEDLLFKRVIAPLTGPESFMVANSNPREIKKLSLAHEKTQTGRLLDIDVFDTNNSLLSPISRYDLGIDERSCFICNNPATLCASRRTHSVDELQKHIVSLFD